MRERKFLRSAVAVVATLAFGLIGWIAYQAVRHPEIQAAQAGYVAPLWIPMILFVGVCLGFLVVVLVKAARRVDAGEDLFAQRHRRRPGSAE